MVTKPVATEDQATEGIEITEMKDSINIMKTDRYRKILFSVFSVPSVAIFCG